MKVISISLVIISLLLVFSGTTLGAIHGGDAYRINHWFDTWYTIEPPKAFGAAGYYNTSDDKSLELDYFGNNQTFLSLRTDDDGGASTTTLCGSYLFNFGFFIGTSFRTGDDVIVSPGYRLKLDEDSYLALSVNYNQTVGKISVYDLDLGYYADNWELDGSITSNVDYGDYYWFDLNYKTSDTLTLGGGITYYDDAEFNFGLSYTGIKNAILDATIYSERYRLSGVYYFGKLGIGIETDEDSSLTYKARYQMEQGEFAFFYYDNYQSFDLVYNIKFK